MIILTTPLIILSLTLTFCFLFPNCFLSLLQELAIYYKYSLKLSEGLVPYRDFQLEYPPLALAFFYLPQLLHFWEPISFHTFCLSIYCINAFLSLLLGLAFLHTWYPNNHAEKTAAAFKFLLLIAIITPISIFRFDIFPAFLTAFSAYFLCREHPFLSGIFLGLGTLSKLYPVILLPLFLLYLLANKKKHALLPLLAGIAFPLLFCLPLSFVKPDWPMDFLGYHLHRGLQIESTAAGILLLWHNITAIPFAINFNYGAFHLASPLSQTGITLLTFLAPVLMLWTLSSAWSRFREEKERTGTITSASLNTHALCLLLVFMATNKVFSPQYIVWLLPFIPALQGINYGMAAIFFITTIFIYPYSYPSISQGTISGAMLINFRNFLMLVILGTTFTKAAPNRTPASSRPQPGNKRKTTNILRKGKL